MDTGILFVFFKNKDVGDQSTSQEDWINIYRSQLKNNYSYKVKIVRRVYSSPANT